MRFRFNCLINFNICKCIYAFIYSCVNDFIAGLAKIAEEIREAGGKCYTYCCDITNKEEVYRTAKAVQIEVGNVSKKANKLKLQKILYRKPNRE